MKTKFISLIFFLIISIFVSCKEANSKIYKNNKIGFSFEIPEDCIVAPKSKGLDNYYIRIYIKNPEDFPDGKKQFEEIKNNIENKKYPNIPGIPSTPLEYKKINNFQIVIDFHAGYDVYDGVIGKRIVFVKNNKLIIIILQYECEEPKNEEDFNNLKIKFKNIYKEYFKEAKNKKIPAIERENYIIEKIDKEIKKNKKDSSIPIEIVKLFEKFDVLMGSLKIDK